MKIAVALFPGRFQPFHQGHLQILKEAAENFEDVIVLIGSAQYSRTEDNPFSLEERKEMISRVLAAAKLDNVVIREKEDDHDDEVWVHNVIHRMPWFDTVYAGDNRLVAKLFSAEGKKVIEHDRFKGISATEIRRRIESGAPWDDQVPPEVAEYLEEIDGDRIIKRTEEMD
ncbi:MAG: nicotinamide-nucleotide adenylyltransferase [archaeon]